MTSDTPTRPLPDPHAQREQTNLHTTHSTSEKENLNPKAVKRPLPVPKEVQPVAAATFYGATSSKSQPSTAGSSHTTYADALEPPPYVKESVPFREPELVPDEDASQPFAAGGMGTWGDSTNFPVAGGGWDTVETPWDTNWGKGAWDTRTSATVDIDGRVDDEELNWADKEIRAKHKRPGPGLLPPLLTQVLHNPDHTLYNVTAFPPDTTHVHSRSGSTSAARSSSPTAAQPAVQSSVPPPSQEEVRTSIPHPNAYYCKEHHGWVLLFWKSSPQLPPIASSYVPRHPFPDQARRKRTMTCVSQDEQSTGQANRTHHFHKYERAVDARDLMTPYRRSEWELEARKKQKYRKMTVHENAAPTPAAEQVPEEPEGDLLDLYLCCQCSTYCLVSEVIPGVITLRVLEEFNKDKLDHPQVGRSAEVTLVTGWETVITILSNKLWKGENRVLPVTRPKFQSKLGWNGSVRRIFDALDFKLEAVPSSASASGGDTSLVAPSVDPTTPEGKRMRAKLLRAWVEINVWLTLYHKMRPRESDFHAYPLCVTVESATEMYQTALGAHVSQIPRGNLPNALVGYQPLDRAWKDLGLISSCYSPELLMFAYLAQCRCDPEHTPLYFTQFHNIVDTMKERGLSPPEALEMLIGEERSRHRFTLEDLEKAISILGFGKDNILGVELDEDIDDQFIIDAWKNALKRAWREQSDKASQLRGDLNDAFKIVAEWRSSSKLRQAWERDKGPAMTEDTAYSTLDVPKDVDESMLITIFNLRVEDQPLQGDKMREALAVIAEVRDSQRLRDFLSTGRDTGDMSSENALDMPRGLNQLGNTCYLNSLLQYFYTIKDLRAVISAVPNNGGKLDESKFTDDDLKRHRVGGRLVTRREIQRSKRFVHQLAELFWNLEYCDTPAVTPTKELAKLALVTSLDEEEDEQSGTGTDASNDTDATLVDDGPVRSAYETATQSPVQESSAATVLGKRGREIPHTQSVDVDGETADVDKDGYVMVSKPATPLSSSSASENVASSSKQKTPEDAADVEMVEDTQKASSDSKPPPLPPRRPKEVGDSVMMFGRQHDVSECMDNCMFQIETALLDFQDEEMANTDPDKTSVVKRLFYGKKRQRLTPLTTSMNERRQRSLSMHEKEDVFSHLHINVSDEGFDLYDGLGRYFDDVVEFNGVKKRMEVTLVDLPPLLQIQLQRVQFDRETQQAYKSQAYVKFWETICMDRFLDSADVEKRARSKELQTRLNTARDRIQRLTQGKHAPFAPALGGLAAFLSKKAGELPEVGEDLASRLRLEQNLVISELERQRAEAARLKRELESIWENDHEAAYELTAVFIHRGSSPSFGHYFLYARNLPSKPDQWFKYNDSSVTIVSKDEVLADTTGSTANPYMLVFARKDVDLIDTVRRFDPETLQDA